MKIRVGELKKEVKKQIDNIQEQNTVKLSKLIKEETDEQHQKEEQFDGMIQRIGDALEKFSTFLIKNGTSPEEYKKFMNNFNKVFTGLKQIELQKIQLNMSRSKFLGKDKKEEEQQPTQKPATKSTQSMRGI